MQNRFLLKVFSLVFLCHASNTANETVGVSDHPNLTQSFSEDKNASDAATDATTQYEENPRLWDIGTIFGHKNDTNSIVVEANNTEPQYTFFNNRNVRHQGLSPDSDKSDLFANPFYMTESDIETEDTNKKVPSHFSLGSFIPSLANPLSKLPDLSWLKKKKKTTITITTTIFQEVIQFV